MAAPISLDREPTLPTGPKSPVPIVGHPPLSRDDPTSASSPQPSPQAAVLAYPAPDPAASCGMPDRPLEPLHSSASSARHTRLSPSRARRGAGGAVLPLADRCWDLFCQGHSYSAIGRTLGIDRETAARHVKAMHAQVQADRRADRALALSRALATQLRIQAAAWDLLALTHAELPAAADCSLRPVRRRCSAAAAGEGSEAGSIPSSVSSVSPAVRSAPSLADCARLLNVILASAREAARLELLYDRDAPARTADQDPQDKTVHVIIERVGDPCMPPTQLTPTTPSGAPEPPPTLVSPPPSPPAPSQSSPRHSTAAEGPANRADRASPDSVCSSSHTTEPMKERPTSLATPLTQPEQATEQPSPEPLPSSASSASSASPSVQGKRAASRWVRGEAPHARLRHARFGLPVAYGYPLG
jgi:DNA-binding CsgD family transcriptional regulator